MNPKGVNFLSEAHGLKFVGVTNRFAEVEEVRAKSSDVHFGHFCYKNSSKSALKKVPQDTIKIEKDPWQGNLVECQLLGTLDLEVAVELHRDHDKGSCTYYVITFGGPERPLPPYVIL